MGGIERNEIKDRATSKLMLEINLNHGQSCNQVIVFAGTQLQLFLLLESFNCLDGSQLFQQGKVT